MVLLTNPIWLVKTRMQVMFIHHISCVSYVSCVWCIHASCVLAAYMLPPSLLASSRPSLPCHPPPHLTPNSGPRRLARRAAI